MATRSAVRILVLASLLAMALLLGVHSAGAQGLCQTSTCSADELQASGSLYRICMPEPGCWNGDLVIFAHGYVAFNEEVAIPEDQLSLPGGVSLPELINLLGFAFATTSYPLNGLAIQEGIEDVRELVGYFGGRVYPPNHVYLVGASEGGAVTALAVERHPEVFSGGLATCGPVGSFRHQVNYWGDFRVLFDYFFPGVIPGSAVSVPDDVIEHWEDHFAPRVRAVLQAHPSRARQLLRVARVPYDLQDPATVEESVLGILWYNVFATNDANDKLGGQPFDNRMRFYIGSSNDFLLNLRVKRYRADAGALAEIEANYETSGRLASPLVTMHTTGDPIVPYWHEPLYRLRVWLAGSGMLHDNLPVFRYGHCQFEANEALVAFVVLVLKARAMELSGLPAPPMLE